MRNVTGSDFYGYGPDGKFHSRHTGPPPNPTPLTDTLEGPEDYRLYRLCPCENCAGTGKVRELRPIGGDGNRGTDLVRCKVCRGEGKNLELVATCGTKEAVGTALVTLTEEGEFDECPFGLMHRPEGEKGRWLLKPWGPSARNISDAGRTLAKAPRPPRDSGKYSR